MMTMHFSYIVLIEPVISSFVPARILYLLICYVPSFLICLVFFPMTIPLFTILYSVDSKSRSDIVDRLEDDSYQHLNNKSDHHHHHQQQHNHGSSIRFAHNHHQ